jgi:hypothetical protein
MYTMQLVVLCPNFFTQWGFMHWGLLMSEACYLLVEIDANMIISIILALLLPDFMALNHTVKNMD